MYRTLYLWGGFATKNATFLKYASLIQITSYYANLKGDTWGVTFVL